MKKSATLFLLLAVLAEWALAQPCSFGNAKATLDANNIRAVINQGGRLFTNTSDAGFYPTQPSGADDAATIFGAGLWIGGVDSGGNLKMSASDYEPGFFAGPLDPGTSSTSKDICSDWNRVFTVKGSEITAFLNALAGPTLPVPADFPTIFGWPGRENPHFSSVHGFDLPFNPQGLAPFLDANADGRYNPLDGDYPAVMLRGLFPFVPAAISWCVFNDQGGGAAPYVGAPLLLEFQLTAWAFDCEDQPVLNNTVFTSHKIINRAFENTDSVSIGLWVDFDLGCFADDYIGCDPVQNCFYAYNQDAIDGFSGMDCSSVATFADQIPVQTGLFLGGQMEKFILAEGFGGANPGTGNPSEPLEYYNFLNGHWLDNTPLTFGGNGYDPVTGVPTDYAYPDPPSDPNGWSMCTANLAFGDRRAIASRKLGRMQPGQVEEFNMAFNTHWGGDLPCDIGDALADVAAVRAAYDGGFAGVCSGLTTPVQNPRPGESALRISPNPNNGFFRATFGGLSLRRLDVFAPDGRLVQSLAGLSGEQADIRLDNLASGVYWLRATTQSGVFSEKMIVER